MSSRFGLADRAGLSNESACQRKDSLWRGLTALSKHAGKEALRKHFSLCDSSKCASMCICETEIPFSQSWNGAHRQPTSYQMFPEGRAAALPSSVEGWSFLGWEARVDNGGEKELHERQLRRAERVFKDWGHIYERCNTGFSILALKEKEGVLRKRAQTGLPPASPAYTKQQSPASSQIKVEKGQSADLEGAIRQQLARALNEADAAVRSAPRPPHTPITYPVTEALRAAAHQVLLTSALAALEPDKDTQNSPKEIIVATQNPPDPAQRESEHGIVGGVAGKRQEVDAGDEEARGPGDSNKEVGENSDTLRRRRRPLEAGNSSAESNDELGEDVQQEATGHLHDVTHVSLRPADKAAAKRAWKVLHARVCER